MITHVRRWLAHGRVLALLALVTLSLTGCIEANSQSTVNADLTGTTTMRIGLVKTVFALISQAGSNPGGTPAPGTPPPSADTDPFADVYAQVAAMGGTATPYEDADFKGVDIVLPFHSLEEMQTQINAILGDGSGSSGTPSGMSGAIVQITTATATASTMRIEGMVDPLTYLVNNPGAAMLATGGTVALAFTFPGAIVDADRLAATNDTTVSWHFKVGDPKATIFVEASKR